MYQQMSVKATFLATHEIFLSVSQMLNIRVVIYLQRIFYIISNAYFTCLCLQQINEINNSLFFLTYITLVYCISKLLYIINFGQNYHFYTIYPIIVLYLKYFYIQHKFELKLNCTDHSKIFFCQYENFNVF